MEIKLSEDQKAALKAIEALSGHDEQELINRFISVGILFYTTSQSNKKLILEILKP